MYNLDLEKAEEPEVKLPMSVGSQEKQKNSEKAVYVCLIDYFKAFDCLDLNNCGNSLKDLDNRLPYLPLEKPVCRSRSNSQKWTWNNGLVQNWERNTRLYIVTMFNLYVMRNAGLALVSYKLE